MTNDYRLLRKYNKDKVTLYAKNYIIDKVFVAKTKQTNCLTVRNDTSTETIIQQSEIYKETTEYVVTNFQLVGDWGEVRNTEH